MTDPEPSRPTGERRSNSRRPRRSTAEVKRLILESARNSFQCHGYNNSRTKDIADQAGVVEKVIFRHYGSKAGLFEAAVIDTVATFLHEHIAAWRDHFDVQDHDIAPPTAAFIAGLYDVLTENRGLLRAYLAEAAFGPVDGVPEHVPDLLGRALRPLDELTATEALSFGPIDIVVTIRATFGMLLSLTVYGDLLFPAGAKPSREAVIEECTALVLDGWRHRAPGQVADGMAPPAPRYASVVRQHASLEDPSESSTLERIVHSARACFIRFGVRETRMSDIAESAGLVRQTLYDWVSNRDKLVELAIEQRIHELAADIRRMPLDPQLTTREQLVEVLAVMVEIGRSDEEFENLSEALPEREAFRFLAGPSELTDAVVDILTPLFDRARKEGSLRTDMGTRGIAEWVQLVVAPLRYREGLDPLTLRATLRFYLLPAILREDA